jgi:hypothetical protein
MAGNAGVRGARFHNQKIAAEKTIKPNEEPASRPIIRSPCKSNKNFTLDIIFYEASNFVLKQSSVFL